MNNCIFCRAKSVDLTDEHIFPAAIGGKLVVKRATCARCNHGFSKFEKPLLSELAPIRALLRIKNRRGSIPEVQTTLRTPHEEYDGKLKSDGTVQPKRTVTEIKNSDGSMQFVHRHLSDRQREDLLREATKKGFRYELLEPGEAVRAEVHIGGNLDEIGSLNGLRTVAKIAYLGLAYLAGVRFAEGDSFRKIRDFIMAGVGSPSARQFANYQFASEIVQGPHQHSIMVAGRHDQQRVDAIVRLFGGLCYFVVLSDSYQGADFNKMIVYDAYRGEERGVLVSHLDTELQQLEIVRTSPMTTWDDLPASAKSFCDFLEKAFRGIRLPELTIR